MNAVLSANVFFRIAGFSVFQALLSTFTALLIGLPAAFFCGRRKFFLKNFLLSLSSVPFCIPSLLVALGYVSFFGMNGTLNSFLMFIFGKDKPPVTFLYSFLGIIICHGFYNFPLVMSTVSSAWERLPRAESDAAMLLGAGNFKIFRSITIFQLLPSIISACIPVFLYCFFSFMIVLLFGSVGTTTLEVEIYQQAKVNLNFGAALKLGFLETTIALFLVTIYTFIEQKSKGLKGIFFNGESLEKTKTCGFEKIFAFILFFLIFLFFICPLFSIFYNGLSSKRLDSNFTFYNFIHLFSSQSFWNAFLWTFITALLSGFLCATIAFFYAAVLKIFDPTGRFFIFRIIPIAPMAISSVVVGVLITILVRKGNFLILVLAQSLLNWPVAFRQIYAELEKLPRTTVEASSILSRSPFDTVFRIFIPVSRRSFFRATVFCFALSAGDATLPLVLAIPRFNTLALYTYRLAGRYKFNEACASGVILGILCAVIFSLGKLASGRKLKKQEGSENGIL